MRLPLAVSALLIVSPVMAASFDCSKASTDEERAVCVDPRLSAMDTLLGRAFAEAKKSSANDKEYMAKTMAVARTFLRQRRTCGSRWSCLVGSYVGALEGYINNGSSVEIPSWVDAPAIAGDHAPPSRSLPTALGQCVSTKVTGVHPRLGDGGPVKDEDFDSGTGVEFARAFSGKAESGGILKRRSDSHLRCWLRFVVAAAE